MKKAVGAASLVAMLTACQSYPDQPSGVFSVTGDYQAIADCTYLKLRENGYWRKDDLPSLNKTELVLGTNTVAAGRIDFSASGANETTVSILFPTPIQGRDHYTNQFWPIVESCLGPS